MYETHNKGSLAIISAAQIALANHTTREWGVRLELEIVTEVHFGDAANTEDLSTIE